MKHNFEKWCRACNFKTCLIVGALLIVIQYLMNLSLFVNDSGSTFGLKSTYWNALQNLTGFYRSVTTTTREPVSLPECPIIPPNLQGRVSVNTQIPAWAHIEEDNPLLTAGGRYKPPDCIARNRVAIVVPYRDREIHLKLFLQNLHPFLQRQQLDYGIYIVEMAEGIQFNRALLMNVGFAEAMEEYDYQCFVFHDVDLLPEDDRNLYTCPSMPRHMSTAIDRMKYRLPYLQIFGGVSAMSTKHFRLINGFSNSYFGWGGEDDDIYRRILYKNLTVIRYAYKVARYKMLVHKKATSNPNRYKLLKTAKLRMEADGLSSLNYDVLQMEKKPLYTWILVSVNMTEVLNNLPAHIAAVRKKSPEVRKPEVKELSATGNQSQTHLTGDKSNKSSNKSNVRLPIKQHNFVKPVFVDWIPGEFKGIIPPNLTQYEAAKFIFKPVPVVKQPGRKGAKGKGKSQQQIIKQKGARGAVNGSQKKKAPSKQQQYITLRKQILQQRQKQVQAASVNLRNQHAHNANSRQVPIQQLQGKQNLAGHNIHGLVRPVVMTTRPDVIDNGDVII